MMLFAILFATKSLIRNQVIGRHDSLVKANLNRVRHFLSLPLLPTTVPMSDLYPDANQHACDLLERLLCFDPQLRCTVQEALAHEVSLK